MKAVTKSFLLVLASGSLAVAQTFAQVPPSGSAPSMAPIGSAADEGVRRQNERIEARAKLDQAREAEARKDLEAAARLYDDAWAMADRVGPLADAERQMAVAGLVS